MPVLGKAPVILSINSETLENAVFYTLALHHLRLMFERLSCTVDTLSRHASTRRQAL